MAQCMLQVIETGGGGVQVGVVLKSALDSVGTVARALLVVLGKFAGNQSECSKLMDMLSTSRNPDTQTLRQIMTQNPWWKEKMRLARQRAVAVETYAPEVEEGIAWLSKAVAALPPEGFLTKFVQIGERYRCSASRLWACPCVKRNSTAWAPLRQQQLPFKRDLLLVSGTVCALSLAWSCALSPLDRRKPEFDLRSGRQWRFRGNLVASLAFSPLLARVTAGFGEDH